MDTTYMKEDEDHGGVMNSFNAGRKDGGQGFDLCPVVISPGGWT